MVPDTPWARPLGLKLFKPDCAARKLALKPALLNHPPSASDLTYYVFLTLVQRLRLQHPGGCKKL
jgi:hypothetical protein